MNDFAEMSWERWKSALILRNKFLHHPFYKSMDKYFLATWSPILESACLKSLLKERWFTDCDVNGVMTRVWRDRISEFSGFMDCQYQPIRL